MKEDSPLCDGCRHIDFVAYFRGEPQGAIHLGTRAEIRHRAFQCAFCYLADTAVEYTTLADEEDASIEMTQFCCGDNSDADSNISQTAYCIRITARLKTQWEGFNREQYGDLQLLADDAHTLGLSPLFHGRPIPEGAFNMALARKWIDICQMRHGSLCSTPGRRSEEKVPSPEPVDLLAVDLDEMRLCEMPYGSRFVALSYCWPATPQLTLLRSNRQQLFKRGSLSPSIDGLSETVRDCIKCAKELPFRYLWVDALCIVQDDYEHKGKQLRQMDRVYGAASLTIVSAYPPNPKVGDGLPRYGTDAFRRRRIMKNINGLRVTIASMCAEKALQMTRWDTRCWTFQEHHLSRRLLYFTHVQVYFQCSCNAFCEDTVGEDVRETAFVAPGVTIYNPKARYTDTQNRPRWVAWDLSRAPLRGIGLMLRSYEIALSEYTYREISFPTDILNAFEGVRAVLAQAMETDFWQGLPEIFLDQALCWVLRGPFRRRRTPPGSTNPLPPAPLFPSWTWAGWASAVNLNYYIAIDEYRKEAEWFIVNDDSIATRLDVLPRRVATIKYSLDGNKNVAPPVTDMKKFLPNIVPRHEIDPGSEKWREAKTLACWTTSCEFIIDGTIRSLNGHERVWHQSVNLAIKDEKGATAGCILLPEDFADDCVDKPQKHEFILISRSLRRMETEFQRNLQYFDEDLYASMDWCTLNVMLISRPVGDVALRIGMGVIHEDAWANANLKAAFIRLI